MVKKNFNSVFFIEIKLSNKSSNNNNVIIVFKETIMAMQMENYSIYLVLFLFLLWFDVYSQQEKQTKKTELNE